MSRPGSFQKMNFLPVKKRRFVFRIFDNSSYTNRSPFLNFAQAVGRIFAKRLYHDIVYSLYEYPTSIFRNFVIRRFSELLKIFTNTNNWIETVLSLPLYKVSFVSVDLVSFVLLPEFRQSFQNTTKIRILHSSNLLSGRLNFQSEIS